MWALSSFRRIKGREKKEKYWIHNVFQATAEKKRQKKLKYWIHMYFKQEKRKKFTLCWNV
jgi:hypothetical protein